MEVKYSSSSVFEDSSVVKEFDSYPWSQREKYPLKPKITVVPCVHKGKNRLKLNFAYNFELAERIRAIPNCYWSNTLRSWNIADDEVSYIALKKAVGQDFILEGTNTKIQHTTTAIKAIPQIIVDSLTRYLQFLMNQRFSENTQQNYMSCMRIFLEFQQYKNPAEITLEDINTFNEKYIIKAGRSLSSQNIYLSALKQFYQVIYNREINLDDLHRPRREHRLPQVFSRDEVKKIISMPVNIKHKAMLSTIYSCGLRCGELLHLKLEDVDSERMLLHIMRGKGNKDRVIPLSKKLVELLRLYFIACKPSLYLFEGPAPGMPYSESSVRQVFKTAAKKAGIKRPVKVHWLRHSYATHLLESGTDIRYIQVILGHSSSRTTEIYTHVSTRSLQNIRNPYDDMEM